MRSWYLAASFAFAAALAVVAVACGSNYGVAAEGDGSSSGTSGASAPPGDGGETDGDAQAQGDGRCTVFTDGTTGDFVAEGNVTTGSAGITLEIGAEPTAIRRTYRAAKPIQRSRLTMTVLLDVAGQWPDAETGVGVLALFYGPGTSEETTTTTRLNLRKGDVEIAVWPAPNVPGGTKPVPVVHWGNAFTTASVVTEWAQPGSVAVDIGIFGGKFVGDTSRGPSEELTVVFGGTGSDAAPIVTLTIQRVCVDLS